MQFNKFIWETHGIHAGTENDHVSHGIDELEAIVEKAIEAKNPSITFVIHSPRLTKYRYIAEKDTNIRFIRGNESYLNYPKRISKLREKYGQEIDIKYGVELEWMGSDLGLQWNRSKLFQADEADFVIGSVHFAPEGLPYDGSKEEALELVEMRGGLEAYWNGYLNEMMEMIEYSGDMIQIIGHIDLPKLNVDVPEAILNFETSTHPLANKFRTVLEIISDRNLALDVNMAGKVKGVGVYPTLNILKRAKALNIPVALGTDTHKIEHYGLNYEDSLKYIYEAGYKDYVSFSKLIPEKRTIFDNHSLKVDYTVLNKGIEILNQRSTIKEERKQIPEFSFGGDFRNFLDVYPNSIGMGNFNAIRIRKGDQSVTVSNEIPVTDTEKITGLYSEHLDNPGTISAIFNTLASEGINVEKARLKSNNDGTAVAFLDIEDKLHHIDDAIEYIKNTDQDTFKNLTFGDSFKMPDYDAGKIYLLEVDGVELKLAVTKKVILTKHINAPGILLILLSALASKNINIIDMQLAKRNKTGYSALAVDGDESVICKILENLGEKYIEANLINLNSK
ncbi:MAG: histidinol-phosphatase HisJ family protein [Ichthyobacteriaceae bacterium]|nr:histidinol-phosphatase HisJ family protein [Ichthyobacteriaceae bacterium]